MDRLDQLDKFDGGRVCGDPPVGAYAEREGSLRVQSQIGPRFIGTTASDRRGTREISRVNTRGRVPAVPRGDPPPESATPPKSTVAPGFKLDDDE